MTFSFCYYENSDAFCHSEKAYHFMTIMCLKCAFIHVRALIGTSSWRPVPCAKVSNEVKAAPGRSKRINQSHGCDEVALGSRNVSDTALKRCVWAEALTRIHWTPANTAKRRRRQRKILSLL